MVHHLQQQVEHVGMRLLDLVQYQNGVRRFHDGVGQQPALVEADVTRRRPDQARHGVFLHVLAHVEANEADTEYSGELPGELGLAHPGGSGEQKRADRFRCRAQPGARQLHRPDDSPNGVVLPVNDALQPLFQIGETVFVRTRHGTRRNSGHAGDHSLDVRYGNLLANPFALRQELHRRTRFVNHVDGLVRQKAVGDVLGGQFSRRCQGLIAVRDTVMALVIIPQPMQDAFGIRHGRLVDVDLLKPPAKRLVAFEGGFVFGKGGRADAP